MSKANRWFGPIGGILFVVGVVLAWNVRRHRCRAFRLCEHGARTIPSQRRQHLHRSASPRVGPGFSSDFCRSYSKQNARQRSRVGGRRLLGRRSGGGLRMGGPDRCSTSRRGGRRIRARRSCSRCDRLLVERHAPVLARASGSGNRCCCGEFCQSSPSDLVRCLCTSGRPRPGV